MRWYQRMLKIYDDYLLGFVQWRNHWGDKGGRVPPLTAKICQKSEKKGGGKSGKIGKKDGKNREEREKSGSFFHFAPPDR